MKSAAKFIFHLIFSVLKFIYKFFLAFFKFIFRGLKYAFVAAIVCLVLFVVFVFTIDHILKFAINNSVAYLEMNSTVEAVNVHILTQTVSLKKIVVKNPSGFMQKDAFSAEKIDIKFDIFAKDAKVKRVSVQNPKIKIEGKFGKRIIAPSIHKSNFFAIGREFLALWSLDLEEMMMGESKGLLDTFGQLEKNVADLKFLAELRVDNLVIENGLKDSFIISSIVFHNGAFIVKDFSSVLCGVESSLQEGLVDLANQKMGFSGFRLKNPEGYPKDNAVAVKRVIIDFKYLKADEIGKVTPTIEKIFVDSPTIKLEDKAGRMLGAVGVDNNFIEIGKNLSVLVGVDVNDIFNEEFEGVEEGKEFKIPEIKLEHIHIKNVKLACKTKNGCSISDIHINNKEVLLEQIYSYVEGLRLQLKSIRIDSVNQRLILDEFSLKNPEGYPDENAFHFGELSLSTNIKEDIIKGQKVLVIEALDLSDYFVRLDSKSGKFVDLFSTTNNLLEVLGDVKKSTSLMPMYEEAVKKEMLKDPAFKPKKFIVKEVIFNGGSVKIGPKGDDISLPLEPMKLTDVGLKEGGITAHEITTIIVSELAVRAISSAESAFMAELERSFFQPIIDFFEGLSDLIFGDE